MSAMAQWLHGLWEYYREYTHTAIHAAATAALTAFGLLIFVNRLFVLLAIASYIFPPIFLYSIGFDVSKPSTSSETTTNRVDPQRPSGSGFDTVGNDGNTDSDTGDGDTDSDSDDGDTDSDSDDGDTDSDSDR